MEALSNGLVSQASGAPAAGALLFGFCSPDQDQDWQEQQRCPPSEKAGHWFSYEWCVPTGEQRSALTTRKVYTNQYVRVSLSAYSKASALTEALKGRLSSRFRFHDAATQQARN